jgi:hypothetical protein
MNEVEIEFCLTCICQSEDTRARFTVGHLIRGAIKMTNQEQPPNSAGRRVLMLIVFVISFIAAYFLVSYLMHR